MKIPRNLSGRTVAEVLVNKLQYRIVHQRGSHIVLETETPAHQRIVIPDHMASHKHVSRGEIVCLF